MEVELAHKDARILALEGEKQQLLARVANLQGEVERLKGAYARAPFKGRSSSGFTTIISAMASPGAFMMDLLEAIGDLARTTMQSTLEQLMGKLVCKHRTYYIQP